ncbi:MAG TPA: NAD kinase [Casimicrobiaceae bacterium]|nr:NAD kinase [Casimicrobiaceae bacterium]
MPAPPDRFPRIALVGRPSSPGIDIPLRRLATFLGARGHQVVIEEESAAQLGPSRFTVAPADAIGARADLAIVVGGDGTMLSIARRLAALDVPLIGINQGRLGFLTDIPLARMEATLEAMLAGRFLEERRTLLDATVTPNDGEPARALALNDVVINRGSLGTMIDCAIDIDGRRMFTMRADGMIVATPTGSTAYALSAGGPILAPGVPAWALVPVAPHALTHRPIVVGDSATIRVTVIRGRDAAAHCDGQVRFPLAEGESVTVKRAAFTARFLHPDDHDYFAMLRQKLHWSETPDRLREHPHAEP